MQELISNPSDHILEYLYLTLNIRGCSPMCRRLSIFGRRVGFFFLPLFIQFWVLCECNGLVGSGAVNIIIVFLSYYHYYWGSIFTLRKLS